MCDPHNAQVVEERNGALGGWFWGKRSSAFGHWNSKLNQELVNPPPIDHLRNEPAQLRAGRFAGRKAGQGVGDGGLQPGQFGSFGLTSSIARGVATVGGCAHGRSLGRRLLSLAPCVLGSLGAPECWVLLLNAALALLANSACS